MDKEYYRLYKKIKPQMLNNYYSRQLLKSTDSASSWVFLICVISFLLNYLLRGSLNYYFIFIHSMQIIVHLPMFHNRIPGNYSAFNAFILPIVMFDIFDSEYTSGYMS